MALNMRTAALLFAIRKRQNSEEQIIAEKIKKLENIVQNMLIREEIIELEIT